MLEKKLQDLIIKTIDIDLFSNELPQNIITILNQNIDSLNDQQVVQYISKVIILENIKNLPKKIQNNVLKRIVNMSFFLKNNEELISFLKNKINNEESETMNDRWLEQAFFNITNVLLVKLLIKFGANVNQINEISGWSPLHKQYETII